VAILGGYRCRDEENCNLEEETSIIESPRTNKNCNPLSPLREPISGAAAIFNNGLLMVCGGKTALGFNKECYVTVNDYQGEWRRLPFGFPIDLEHLRASAVNAIDGGAFFTGGLKNDGRASKETLIFDFFNENFNPGPMMPRGKYGHCQVTFGDNLVFVTGGGPGTYIFDLRINDVITVEDDLPSDITFGACGKIETDEFDTGKFWYLKVVADE